MRWLLQSLRPEQWVAAIDYWTAWMIAAGLRDRTIELRRYQIGHLAQAHLNRSPWALTSQDLVTWLATQQWAPETRKSYRSALRSFYGWGVTAGKTRQDPAAGLRVVRVGSPPPRPAPDRVFEAAFAAAGDRDRLILALAAYAGLRRAEIAGLRWHDVGQVSIRVTGKGGRVRVVPLHPALRAELAGEYERRACGRTGSGYRFGSAELTLWVFPGRSGGHLSADAAGRAASRVLGPGWTGHSLRHRFATRAYAGSRDLLAVQALLGHTKPETSKRYTELADDALAAAVRSV